MPKAHRLFAGIVAALLASSLGACAGGGSVASVDGTAISRADFDQKLEASPASRNTLQAMVTQVLLENYAKKNNINVTDADIAAKEDQIKANFPAGSWDDMLKQRGLTEADVHTDLAQSIIIDKAVGSGVNITPAQIKDYFDKNRASFDKPEQVQARHILVATLATAQKVEAQLKAGAKFEDMAKEYSIDPGSKDKGGELGLFRHGQMVPAFDQAAFSLPIGKISEPVHSPFGFHIIQVEARQPGVKATLANTTAKITDTLRQQQENPLIQPFIANLTTKANIQITDPNPAFAGLYPSPAAAASAPAAAASAPAAAASAPAAAATAAASPK